MEFTVPLICYSKLPGESEPQALVEKKSCLVAVCLVDYLSYLNSLLHDTTSPVYTTTIEVVRYELTRSLRTRILLNGSSKATNTQCVELGYIS